MREQPLVRAFIQARMSSTRFPGKVLAPLRGRPLIACVIAQVAQVISPAHIVVVTSTEPSDDPLVCYVRELGAPVYRGPLGNVFERFRRCASAHPCNWVLRLSADSPLLDSRVLKAVLSQAEHTDCDLVTTIFPRTFPRGQNAELIRVDTLLHIDVAELSADDQEHVTPFFYRHPNRFRIVNVRSGNPQLAELSLAVDTIEDLRRLELWSEADTQRLSYDTLTTRPV